MEYIIGSIILVGVTQGFILLEEELLIIIASIVWVDAAGKLINGVLVQELEYKSEHIKEKYLWFLEKKRELDSYVINLYSKRKGFIYWIKGLQDYVIITVIMHSLHYLFNNYIILKRYGMEITIVNVGIVIIKELFSVEIQNIVNILNENHSYINKYSTVKYLVNTNSNFALGILVL